MTDMTIAAPAVTDVQDKVVALLAECLKVETTEIDLEKQLTSYGLDSIDAVTMVGDIEDWLEIELPSTLFWDCENIREVASYIVDNFDDLAE